MSLLESCVVEPGYAVQRPVLRQSACWSRSSPCCLMNPHSKESTIGHWVESEGRDCNCFSFKFNLVQLGLRHRAHDELARHKGVAPLQALPRPETIPDGWEKCPEERGSGSHSPSQSLTLCLTISPRAFVVSPCLICGNFLLPLPLWLHHSWRQEPAGLGTGAFVHVSMMVPCLFECFAERHCPLTWPRAFSVSGPSMTFQIFSASFAMLASCSEMVGF